LRLARETDGVEAYFILTDGRTASTDGMIVN